jgi:hypothetical protein
LESITFEVQINPPEGEKKVVTWEGRWTTKFRSSALLNNFRITFYCYRWRRAAHASNEV